MSARDGGIAHDAVAMNPNPDWIAFLTHSLHDMRHLKAMAMLYLKAIRTLRVIALLGYSPLPPH